MSDATSCRRRYRRQLDEPDPVVEPIRQPVTHLGRQARLPHPAGAEDRHQPLGAQHPGQPVDLVLAADETGQRGREPAGPGRGVGLTIAPRRPFPHQPSRTARELPEIIVQDRRAGNLHLPVHQRSRHHRELAAASPRTPAEARSGRTAVSNAAAGNDREWPGRWRPIHRARIDGSGRSMRKIRLRRRVPSRRTRCSWRTPSSVAPSLRIAAADRALRSSVRS